MADENDYSDVKLSPAAISDADLSPRELVDRENREDPMTVSELAKHFNEPVPVERDIVKDLQNMTKEEIEKFEEEQKYSSDIYRVKARVQNHVGASLTPVGEILCNSYVHVLKAFYGFADTLDEAKKKELRDLIFKHENMPAQIIALSKFKR